MSRCEGIGFVGLGAMGGRMAATLLERGHELSVFDVRPDAVKPLVRRGAAACDSPARVADVASCVFVSLPTPEIVREVVCGEQGVVHGGAVNTFVDLSTTGAETASEIAETLRVASVDYVDAPVTGGVAGLESGTLAVIVSGAPEAIERVRPLLETFGEIHRVGSTPGQAQTAKLLNNLLSATAMAITAEALVLGVRAGLDPSVLIDVFNAGSGRNTATAKKFPAHVLTRRFASGFRLKLMAKDVELCLGDARNRHVSMPVGGAVQQLWTLAAASAQEDDDHTALAHLYETWNGVTLAAGEGAVDVSA